MFIHILVRPRLLHSFPIDGAFRRPLVGAARSRAAITMRGRRKGPYLCNQWKLCEGNAAALISNGRMERALRCTTLSRFWTTPDTITNRFFKMVARLLL